MAFVKDSNPSKLQIVKVENTFIQLNHGTYHQSLLLNAQECHPLELQSFECLTVEHFDTAVAWSPEVILLGTGSQCKIPSQDMLAHFLKKTIGFEFMDTPAACRTFAALTSEQRRVAALLILDAKT